MGFGTQSTMLLINSVTRCWSHWCDHTGWDLPWSLLLVFISFYDQYKGEGGIVSEQCKKLVLSRLISLVSEGRKWEVKKMNCDWRLLSPIGFCVFWRVLAVYYLRSCLGVELVVSRTYCDISFGSNSVVAAGGVVLSSEGS